MQRTRQVVLVGGGHAHVQVLEALAGEPLADARVTVVVDTPIAVYSGMVPGFVAGQYQQDDLKIDVRPLARRCGAAVVVARAVGIDADGRRIILEDGPPVSYDLASIDVGSTVAGLDGPGIAEHAMPTRPIGLFVERVDELIARAREHPAGPPFRVIVVGGGAGGVELLLTVHHRLGVVEGTEVEALLLDGGPRILRGYPGGLARRVERLAAARGIEIRCGSRVRAAENGTVALTDGSRLPYDALIWVTGAVCQPIFVESGLATDDRGFLHVRSTLQAEHHDDLLAAGDCATMIDYPRTAKAGVYAVRQGPYIARNIRAALSGRPLSPYRPQRDFLTLLNAGGGLALGTKWGLSFEGRWVMTLKDRIDRRFMRRFQPAS